MFCPKCGKEIPDSAKFCPICGSNFANDQQAPQPQQAVPQPQQAAPQPQQAAPQPQQAAPQPQQAAPQPQTFQQYQPVNEYAAPQTAAPAAEKKFDVSALLKNKTVLIAAAAVVAVIVLIIIISAIAGSAGGAAGSGYQTIDKAHAVFSNDNGIYVFYGSKQLEEIKGEDVYDLTYSLDRSAIFFTTDEDAMFHISGEKIYDLGENENFEDAYISDNGDVVVIVSYDDGDYIIDMYKNGSHTEVAEVEDSPEIVLSPDGSALVYTIDDDGDTVMMGFNGKETKIGKDLIPVTVSNGGKITYAYNTDKNKLVYIKNFDGETKENIDDEYYQLLDRNADGTEILYANSNSGATMFYTTSLEKPVKVSGKRVYAVYPTYTIPVTNSFKSFLGMEGEKYVKFTLKGDEFEDETVLSEDYAQFAQNGSEFLYVDDETLYRVAAKPDAKEKAIIEELGSSYYYADVTLSKIYFQDDDDNLCYNKQGNIVIDEDDLDDYYLEAMTANGVLIMENDDELYYADGTKVEKIDVKDYDDLIAILVNVVFIECDGELYVSADGKKFEATGIEEFYYED